MMGTGPNQEGCQESASANAERRAMCDCWTDHTVQHRVSSARGTASGARLMGGPPVCQRCGEAPKAANGSAGAKLSDVRCATAERTSRATSSVHSARRGTRCTTEREQGGRGRERGCGRMTRPPYLRCSYSTTNFPAERVAAVAAGVVNLAATHITTATTRTTTTATTTTTPEPTLRLHE